MHIISHEITIVVMKNKIEISTTLVFIFQKNNSISQAYDSTRNVGQHRSYISYTTAKAIRYN